MRTATNEAGTVSFNYDNRSRLENTTDVFGHLLNYEYERTATVNQQRLKLDGALHAVYNYDDANRLTTLTDEVNQNFTFGYDIADRLISKTLPNGVSTTYNYDGMSRLKRLKHQSSTATLFDNQYGYNTANQISQIAELTQTKNFTYDNVNRLTGMTSGAASENYTFDDVGNRNSSHRSSTYNYQPFNKLTATATANYNYDANGNMVSKAEGTNFWRYGFDYENRLVSASTRKQTVRYRYDALGRRVQRYTVGTKENTKFIYDGLDVIMDDNAGTLTKYQNGLGIDDKLKLTSNGVSSYFLQDHLGSMVGLTNSSGATTEQTAYDSFGNVTNNLTTRYQFTGREYDSFTGLHYYRARFYDGNLGRFISEDPIGFAGSDVNLYGYVWNKTILFTDPSGLQAKSGLIFLPEGNCGKKWYGAIGEDFNDMRKEGCECRKSFEEFGINLDDLAQKGIFIGSGDTLSNPNIKSSDLNLSDGDRQKLAGRGSRASTLIGGEYDPRPHIFFNDAAKQDMWTPFSDNRCNVREAFAHELMHAGGIAGKPPGWIWEIAGWDDLSYLNGWWKKPYSNLISNCGCQ